MSDSRVLSTYSYDALPPRLRRQYPIDDVWDEAGRKLRGRPFRFARKGDRTYALITHNGQLTRTSVVDAKCACVLYKIMQDKLAMHDSSVCKLLAQRAATPLMPSRRAEPHNTTVLRRASAADTRRVPNILRLVHRLQSDDPVERHRAQAVAAHDDGAEWQLCCTYLETTSPFANPSVSELRAHMAPR
jgi:hypothetical protein